MASGVIGPKWGAVGGGGCPWCLSPRGQKVKFAYICIDDYSSQSIVPIDLWMVLLDQQVVEIWENGV